MSQILKITTSEGWGSNEDPKYYLQLWASTVRNTIQALMKEKNKQPGEIIFAASVAAKQASGFESVIAQLQKRNATISGSQCLRKLFDFACFLECAENLKDPDKVSGFIKMLSGNGEAHLLDNIVFTHIKTTPFEFDLYSYRTAEIRFTITPIPEPEEFGEGELDAERFQLAYSRAQSESQRKALLTALEIIAAQKIEIPLIKCRQSKNLLFCGPSGSGKTWIAARIAYILGIQHFSTTPGSWHLRGSSGHERPTSELLLRDLENGPALVVVDEIDKYRQGADNSNYFRSVLDEQMALMDGRITGFRHTSASLANLKQSLWIGAGAFQDLYRKKLGDICFAEQIDDMAPLTFHDIQSSGWLPDELLNRFAADLIEIRPPTTDETLKTIKGIARMSQTGGEWTDRGLMERAQDIVKSLQAVRGIQRFALDCARSRVRKDVAALAKKR